VGKCNSGETYNGTVNGVGSKQKALGLKFFIKRIYVAKGTSTRVSIVKFYPICGIPKSSFLNHMHITR
jgi:hypothetical protein